MTATSAWGHRPFEDAQALLWPQIRRLKDSPGDQAAIMRSSLVRAFGWWQFIQRWRAANPGHPADVPVREMVVEIARHTYGYSIPFLQHGHGLWPFNRAASTAYLIDKDDAIAFYTSFPNAAGLARPLFEDGIGATVAFLTAAAETLPEPP